MIEEKKVWKRFTGYKNIEANPDSVVMLLVEMEDGWRWFDHALFGKKRWISAHNTPEENIIGYYEIEYGNYIRCRHKVSEPIESIPTDFRGEAAVLWEYGRETIDGYKVEIEDVFKCSDVLEGRVAYSIEYGFKKGPDYITGYHILPDRFHAKFDDGTVKDIDFDPCRNYAKSKRKPKNSIEIKRQKDDSLIVILRKDGQRTTLPFDSPELYTYRPGLEWIKDQMFSMNADNAKISVE